MGANNHDLGLRGTEPSLSVILNVYYTLESPGGSEDIVMPAPTPKDFGSVAQCWALGTCVFQKLPCVISTCSQG